MSVAPEQDAPRPGPAPDAAFLDAVTFAFGDPVAGLYGHARIGLGADGAGGFAMLFAGTDVAGASMQSGVEVGDESRGSWEGVRAAGLQTRVEQPLSAWALRYEGRDAGFDLRFEARSTPAVLPADSALARAAGLQGYDQLCGVEGTVRAGAAERTVRCLGQRGRIWGAPDLERLELLRTLAAWLGDDRAVMLSAARPVRGRGRARGEDVVAGWIVEDGEPQAVEEPRLSTTYDGELRQQRAGLELWVGEDSELARRGTGIVLCGTTLDFGDLRLATAFFGWRMEDREGVGHYDVLRRIDGGGSRAKR